MGRFRFRLREGWSHLNDAQRIFITLWGPGLTIALVIGAIYFIIAGSWIMFAATGVMAVISVIVLWQMVVTGAKEWPHRRD